MALAVESQLEVRRQGTSRRDAVVAWTWMWRLVVFWSGWRWAREKWAGYLAKTNGRGKNFLDVLKGAGKGGAGGSSAKGGAGSRWGVLRSLRMVHNLAPDHPVMRAGASLLPPSLISHLSTSLAERVAEQTAALQELRDELARKRMDQNARRRALRDADEPDAGRVTFKHSAASGHDMDVDASAAQLQLAEDGVDEAKEQDAAREARRLRLWRLVSGSSKLSGNLATTVQVGVGLWRLCLCFQWCLTHFCVMSCLNLCGCFAASLGTVLHGRNEDPAIHAALQNTCGSPQVSWVQQAIHACYGHQRQLRQFTSCNGVKQGHIVAKGVTNTRHHAEQPRCSFTEVHSAQGTCASQQFQAHHSIVSSSTPPTQRRGVHSHLDAGTATGEVAAQPTGKREAPATACHHAHAGAWQEWSRAATGTG